jgi:hypothetical protein
MKRNHAPVPVVVYLFKLVAPCSDIWHVVDGLWAAAGWYNYNRSVVTLLLLLVKEFYVWG